MQKKQKKEEKKITDAILSCLLSEEDFERNKIKERILSVNKFEFVDYDSVEQSFLEQLYVKEKRKVVYNSKDANQVLLYKIASLLGKENSQVELEIKSDLDIVEKDRKLRTKISQFSDIVWILILILVILQYVYIRWWTLLSGTITLIVFLKIKSIVIHKIH